MSSPPKTFTSISTQTEGTSNKGLGRAPVRDNPNITIYALGNGTNKPQYRKNLCQLFGEEFLAETTQKNKRLTSIIKLNRQRDWNTLKTVSPKFQSLKLDLSITPSECILYDNRLRIPKLLKRPVIDSLRQTHPGQLGMLQLADLIWFPCIHRDVTY